MPGETYSDEHLDAMLLELRDVFKKQFHVHDDGDVEWLLFTFAPGRVNYIGEHVDYMGGWVCPAAVTEGTHILVGRVKAYCTPSPADRKIRFFSTFANEGFEIASGSADLHAGPGGKTWTTFIRGALGVLLPHLGITGDCPALDGVCMAVHNTLTVGAGMSASAAFCVGLLRSLEAVINGRHAPAGHADDRRYAVLPTIPQPELLEIVKLARRIEVEYCGANVGIMDQFISAFGEANQFLFLDCTDLSFDVCDLAPLLGDGEYTWLLIDSMIKHDLMGGTASFYNAVRSDQENAQTKISKERLGCAPFTFSQLVRNPSKYCGKAHNNSAATPVEYIDSCKDVLEKGEYERGRYQVMEQVRTLAFREATSPVVPVTREERVKKVGQLLNDAHAGMRDLMKITTPELDFIQELINEDDGVAGGRMMGGGFGGCIILLLRSDAKERVLATVRNKFKARFGVENTFYNIDKPGCGAFVVSLAK